MHSLGKQDRVGMVSITQVIFHPSHQRHKDSMLIYHIVKRCLDICIALIGLALLALLLPILGFLIFLEDRRAIIYKQQRVGLGGRLFTTYKLRTMVVGADNYLARHPELHIIWKQKGKLPSDPRVTRIGRFLRRTSLDELPQLLNVLRGEMTLVGPRAVQSSELAAFGELSQLRLKVKPGLTGLWQVSGRSSTTYQQRCVLDCIYVMERSLRADALILIKTIPAVLCARGAC